mmetsp:Transcript_54735/g.150867  ORF Transcript_54735/g.150867 Transcript_54735/m.150867 type:complete len:206 (+) Transcript_54735:777-1394(+)
MLCAVGPHDGEDGVGEQLLPQSLSRRHARPLSVHRARLRQVAPAEPGGAPGAEHWRHRQLHAVGCDEAPRVLPERPRRLVGPLSDRWVHCPPRLHHRPLDLRGHRAAYLAHPGAVQHVRQALEAPKDAQQDHRRAHQAHQRDAAGHQVDQDVRLGALLHRNHGGDPKSRAIQAQDHGLRTGRQRCHLLHRARHHRGGHIRRVHNR